MDSKTEAAIATIRLQEHGSLPLYLQIKYQLVYLISTHQLPTGLRLPPVRHLASNLGVNSRTVSQAYRELQAEGLTESSPGRGTFVKSFQAQPTVVRYHRLTELLLTAYEAARGLGFSESEVVQRFALVASQARKQIPVLFAIEEQPIIGRYLNSLRRHLGDVIEPVGVLIGDIERGDPATMELLERHFYVLAFARSMPRLKSVLAEHLDDYEIVTITAVLTDDTIAFLNDLPSATKAVVVSDNQFLHAVLAELVEHSSLDTSLIPAFLPSDREQFLAAAAKAEVVIYTLAVGHMLDGLNDAIPRLELGYDLSPETRFRLRHLFGKDLA